MTLTHDIQLEIATAPSRMATRWRNKKVMWSELVSKCENTHRTPETMKQYLQMSREEQSQRKDIGGFVGGYLREGKRKNGMTEFKTCATLDIDFGTTEIWDDFTLSFSFAAMLYSTHKHTPDNPRYRLVIPFDRKVSPSEYEPVCRYIAGILGIDIFDDTTFELPRLFYWPSTAKDGEYVFRVQDGPICHVDEILSHYTNPMDASEWPMSSREDERMLHEMKKLGDPREKPGIIGAFCRSYSIEEAIETFLQDSYEPTAHENRYTWKKGSVSGGLVCYDGLFAYSHHDTDPASRKMCNAFDLVRLHLYGAEDEGKKESDVTRLPSYARMMDFASKDKRVRKLIVNEKRTTANEDFGEATPEDWTEDLECDKNGKVKPTADNILLILENDPRLKGHLSHDEFSHADLVTGGLPWNKDATYWGSKDMSNLRIYLETGYGIVSRDKIKDAKEAVFTRHRFHPIKDYFRGLEWDGTPRLDSLMSDYLGAERSPLVEAMTRKQFTAAVARVFNPGCKYDYMLVLTGPEGIGKSTLLSKMGGPWFSDSVTTMEGKEAMEQLQKAWIVEMGELTAMKRSEVESVKAFLSRQVDIYRPAYGEATENRPRHCVFFGSTNECSFLKGDSGNRRFWVVPVGVIQPSKDIEDLDGERDQIWAEALFRFKAHEKLYLPTDLEMQARQIQEIFNDGHDDPLIGMVQNYLDTLLPTDWDNWTADERRSYFQHRTELSSAGVVRRDKVCAMEICCELLNEKPTDKSRYSARQVSAIMRRLGGWEPVSSMRFSAYGTQKGFRRIIDTKAPEIDDDDL